MSNQVKMEITTVWVDSSTKSGCDYKKRSSMSTTILLINLKCCITNHLFWESPPCQSQKPLAKSPRVDWSQTKSNSDDPVRHLFWRCVPLAWRRRPPRGARPSSIWRWSTGPCSQVSCGLKMITLGRHAVCSWPAGMGIRVEDYVSSVGKKGLGCASPRHHRLVL